MSLLSKKVGAAGGGVCIAGSKSKTVVCTYVSYLHTVVWFGCSERGALFIRQGLFTNECLLPACFFECKVGGKKNPIISNLRPAAAAMWRACMYAELTESLLIRVDTFSSPTDAYAAYTAQYT